MSLVVGQTVPIVVQLGDGATGKYPRAVVRNNAGTTLSTLNLSHLSSGLYQYNSYTMPDVPYVSVQYIIYSDSGYTTIDTAYGYSAESFDRDGLLEFEVETSYSVKEAFRLIMAALAGKLSGAATTTVVIRDVNDSKDRITATVDSSGNRSAVTYDVS